MNLVRRGFLAGIAGAVLMTSGPAFGLSVDEAKAHVQKTIDDILVLLKQPGSGESRAPQLQQIMENRANVALWAKFSAGRAWREMSDSQQNEYVRAFSQYIALTYARRFDEYAGDPKVTIGNTVDAGKKGIIVSSPIRMGTNEPVAVDWRVSDRGGRVEVVDLIIEGISLAATQREEISAMLDKRGGDINVLIADLRTSK